MKLKTIMGACLIPMNAFLFFLLVAGSRIVVPGWLQVVGRMHPLFLHFPIVLVVGYVCWEWSVSGWGRRLSGMGDAAGEGWFLVIGEGLLAAAAFTAALTALMGMLLSKEAVYDGAAIDWHKWLGAMTAFGLLGVWSFRSFLRRRRLVLSGVGGVLMILILVAGHIGGRITHGENFVLGPVMPVQLPLRVSLEDALVYRDLVEPILAAKCMGCHNGENRKGGLAMDETASLLKGGKSGKLWDSTDAGLGLLFVRVHLPIEVKKHMPPANKPQLTEREEKVLGAWVRGGAVIDKKVAELPLTDTLRMLAGEILKPAEEVYDFAAADEKKVRSMNNNYRVITPLAEGSPALAVNFYGAAAFKGEQIKELEPLREQIVSLNLEKMPVTDKELAPVAQMRNLRALNLGFTKVTGQGLSVLAGLPHLQRLSISGTAIKGEDVAKLAGIMSLKSLYVWKTGLGAADVASLHKLRSDLSVITGFRGDTVRIKLNAPQITTDVRVVRSPLSFSLRHYVPGVMIRYTLDGSDPDSTGTVYKDSVRIVERAVFKAKAYKDGWLPSDGAEALFFSGRFKADSILLEKPVDSNYMKYKPGVLIDQDKGDLSFRNGKYLGFWKNDLQCLLFFRGDVNVSDVTLSTVVDVNGWIMPPMLIEVWGGKDRRGLRLLGSLRPEQPVKARPGYLAPYVIRFPPANVRYLRVVAKGVEKLPEWHGGKGKRGWIMADEIFVN